MGTLISKQTKINIKMIFKINTLLLIFYFRPIVSVVRPIDSTECKGGKYSVSNNVLKCSYIFKYQQGNAIYDRSTKMLQKHGMLSFKIKREVGYLKNERRCVDYVEDKTTPMSEIVDLSGTETHCHIMTNQKNPEKSKLAVDFFGYERPFTSFYIFLFTYSCEIKKRMCQCSGKAYGRALFLWGL